jgi:hypothetical protein
MQQMIEDILSLSEDIRFVAVYLDDEPAISRRHGASMSRTPAGLRE